MGAAGGIGIDVLRTNVYNLAARLMRSRIFVPDTPYSAAITLTFSPALYRRRQSSISSSENLTR